MRRAAVDAIIERGDEREIPLSQWRTLLRDDEEAVRSAATTALGRRGASGVEDLLAMLDDADDTTAAAAAAALSGHGERSVAQRLIQQIARRIGTPPAMAARKALENMSAETVLRAAENILKIGEQDERREAMAVLGSMSIAQAGEILIRCLDIFTDPLDKAAAISALGDGGWQQHWDAIAAMVDGDPVTAYAAVESLSEMCSRETVQRFGELLQVLPEVGLMEVVLGRLIGYGRVRSLPKTFLAMLHPFIADERGNLSLLTLEALRWIDHPDAPFELIDGVHQLPEERQRAMAAESFVHHIGDGLLPIVSELQPEQFSSLATLLQHASHPGGKPLASATALAAVAVRVLQARAALAAFAVLAPPEVAEAISRSEGGVRAELLRAWSTLSVAQKGDVRLDVAAHLLHNDARVALAAIECVHAYHVELVPLLVDIALSETDPSTARAATERLRVLCLHESQESADAS